MAFNPCGVTTTNQMLAREVLTWVYRRGERVLGKAVFAAKCSLIARYPTNDNYYGPAYLWTLFGDPALRIRYAPLTGVEESAVSEARRAKAGPTMARDVLFLPASLLTLSCGLFDPTGRKVMSLRPGPNDVSRLRPGVYFLNTGARLILY